MKRYVIASLGALTIVLGLGCSSGPRDLCVDRQVRCQAPESCDPTDGVCKCGGLGGVDCTENEVCDLDTNTCQSTRCGEVDCAAGTSCDTVDGICKCGGTGGTECSSTQVCDPAIGQCVAAVDCSLITCPSNETCDPVSGSCFCGPGACAVGQTCVDVAGTPTCTEDRCSGVTCVGSSSCDPSDGFCKCNGAICKGGEACECPTGADGGCADTARVCKAGSACAGKTCASGLTCDPADGQCKCGGPGGPVCSEVQVCDLGPPPQCEGGEQCRNLNGTPKECGGGTSCDPEDGLCKCGGRGGTVCDPESEMGANDQEICVSSGFQNACRQRCNPVSPNCPAGQGCYYDSSATTGEAYCIAPADPPSALDRGCSVANECFSVSSTLADGGVTGSALHCAGLSAGGIAGICRAYCDVASGSSGCPAVPLHDCIPITTIDSVGIGYCRVRP